MPYVWLVLGLVLLIVGAESLVRGASRLARAAGLSPLIVGLTVVAFGTSAPELFATGSAALAGRGDLALGNVVGSNIFNVLLILGLSSVIAPLIIAEKLVQREVPIMIAASVVAGAMALDGTIGRLEGALLFAALIAYLVTSIRLERRYRQAGPNPPGPSAEAAPAARPEAAPARRSLLRAGLFVLVGLGLLAGGSRLLVEGAVEIARTLGISELVIGLTITAAGTSLPEVAASVLAALRGERDIAAGNVIGSNIFNLLGVLGVASGLSGAVPVAENALLVDIPIMVAAAVACLPIFFTGHRIGRWEGALFLGYYGLYMAMLLLDATRDPLLPLVQGASLFVVMPLSVVTLAVFTYRHWRERRGQGMGPGPRTAPTGTTSASR
jgi:cation:H+ antiporter